MRAHHDTDAHNWQDPAAVERLRSLWDEGHSTKEIGRRLGITKNSVVGKARRMNFPPRPNPVRWLEPSASKPDVATKKARPSTPPAPALSMPPAADQAAAAQAPVSRQGVLVPLTPPASLHHHCASPIGIFTQGPPQRSCCWPIGEPGKPDFRFCEVTATSGKPYCTEHAEIAYVKLQDRREGAALDRELRRMISAA